MGIYSRQAAPRLGDGHTRCARRAKERRRRRKLRETSIAKSRKTAAKSDAAIPSATLLDLINTTLDDGKAEDIIVMDVADKTTISDFMVIASGRSQRQVASLAENLIVNLKHAGFGTPGVEGRARADWVLIDAGDVIVHLFRPEIRTFYNLEKMWAVAPDEAEHSAAASV